MKKFRGKRIPKVPSALRLMCWEAYAFGLIKLAVLSRSGKPIDEPKDHPVVKLPHLIYISIDYESFLNFFRVYWWMTMTDPLTIGARVTR